MSGGADYEIELQAEGLGFADAALLPSMRHVVKSFIQCSELVVDILFCGF